MRKSNSRIKESKSPIKKLTGKNSELKELEKFGCTVFVQECKISRSKFNEKVMKYKNFGYDEQSPGDVVHVSQTKTEFFVEK